MRLLRPKEPPFSSDPFSGGSTPKGGLTHWPMMAGALLINVDVARPVELSTNGDMVQTNRRYGLRFTRLSAQSGLGKDQPARTSSV